MKQKPKQETQTLCADAKQKKKKKINRTSN